MKKRYCLFIFFISICIFLKAQPCLQPGALVSVKNYNTQGHEYIVFKFIKPYSEKGILSKTNDHFFRDTKELGTTYHRIVFNHVAHLCVDKVKVKMKTTKIINFKNIQRDQMMVTYEFQLSKNAKITKHYISQHNNHYFVKIRID